MITHDDQIHSVARKIITAEVLRVSNLFSEMTKENAYLLHSYFEVSR